MNPETLKNTRQGSLPGNGYGSHIVTVDHPSPGSFIMEEWKTIPIAKNYEASNRGRIRSKPRIVIRRNGRSHTVVGTILSPGSYKGYKKVAIIVNGQLKTYTVHRLVALTWINNYDNKETVNHKNGKKNDNKISNLEWATRKENIDHAIRAGLFEGCHIKGSQVGTSILTEEEVLEIRSKYIPRIYTRQMLADDYGVTISAIKDILIRRSWKHI